jgi:hypothetical protein
MNIYQSIFHKYAGSVASFTLALYSGAVAAEESSAAALLAWDFESHCFPIIS